MIKHYWHRLLCVFKDHDIAALFRWSPDVVCMHLVCRRCGKEFGHLDLPTEKTKKESVH